jgi:hypothetical protein
MKAENETRLLPEFVSDVILHNSSFRSRALHLSLFEQPGREFNTLMIQFTAMGTELYFT